MTLHRGDSVDVMLRQWVLPVLDVSSSEVLARLKARDDQRQILADKDGGLQRGDGRSSDKGTCDSGCVVSGALTKQGIVLRDLYGG